MNNERKKSPQRMCIACRRMFDKKDLLRIVKSPYGIVSVDYTGKKNGRGAYICSDPKCRLKCKKGILQKQFDCEVPDELYRELEQTQNDER